MEAAPLARLSIDEFLDWLETQDEKHELVDGRAVGMAGGTVGHARIARRILSALEGKLSGTGCEAFGSDLAVRTGLSSTRFPDVSIHCGLTEPKQIEDLRILQSPRVLIEVLSPSTRGHDRAVKLIEYRALPSVDMVVLIQPATQQLDIHERMSGNEWRSVTHLRGSPLVLRDPAVTLSPEEIFGRE